MSSPTTTSDQLCFLGMKYWPKCCWFESSCVCFVLSLCNLSMQDFSYVLYQLVQNHVLWYKFISLKQIVLTWNVVTSICEFSDYFRQIAGLFHVCKGSHNAFKS